MGKEVLSIEEFNNKSEYMGNDEKKLLIMKIMKVNEYFSMKEICKRSKVKWVYNEVRRLYESGELDRGKKGKKYFYIKMRRE